MNSNRILIIGPSWVGDTVMAQCLFKLLKKRLPHSTINVLAPAWTFSLLSRMPEVDLALEIPFTHGELKLWQRYQLAKQLCKYEYDRAIVLPNSFKAAIIPWMAKIPVRTGWRGEYRYGVINDMRYLNEEKYPLMIQQYMALGLQANEDLTEPYSYPEFLVSEQSQQETLSKLKPVYRGRPILALCAGAEFGPSKRWPEAYYAIIANAKIAEGWDVWLLGSQKDRFITDKIMQLTNNQCENLAGKPQLAETIDLLSLTSGVISNDSGLMHIAAALNKSVIAIYGSTSPNFTPPLSSKATILKLQLDCQPCFERTCPLEHHRCMRELKPEQVLNIVSNWKY